MPKRLPSVAIAVTAITLLLAPARQAAAQSPQPPKPAKDSTVLPKVTIIGSAEELLEARAEILRQPGSVTLVGPEVIRTTRQANLKDALRYVPGLYIAPRQGASDESQISIRGSGLRNNYHARGLNILINGMPYRNSDGFTDFEALEMMSTEAITVYKGGNAFRFGGATLGGAIDIKTRTGYTADRVELVSEGGSFGFFKTQLSSGGVNGKLDWYGAYSRTTLDGYRDHGNQGRDRINAHVGYVLTPNTDLRAFYVFAHASELYSGVLTPEEAEADPTQAVQEYVDQDWSRYLDLHHVGLQLRSQLRPGVRLEIAPYFQYRNLDHPIFNVLYAQSKDMGAEFRLEALSGEGGRNRFTLGALPSALRMRNRRYQNNAGEHGALAKDQDDAADGFAVYAEDAFRITPRLTAIAGLRSENQRRATTDHFLSNGDQSDDRTFSAVLPRLGVTFDVSPNVQLYANASRSYEPPLIAELNSLTVDGFIALEAQDAMQYEIGTRGRNGAFSWDLSVYQADLKNEILNLNVEPFPGAGFLIPTYRNAERTRHIGLEAGAKYTKAVRLLTPSDLLTFDASFTLNRFTYVRDDLYDGNRVPGLPDAVFNGAVRYVHPSGFSLTPTVEIVPGSYFVNSQNDLKNEGWTVIGLRAEYGIPRTELSVFVAGENLTDQLYSASVQIDAATRQFFEPGDGRSFYLGMRWKR